MEGYVKNLSPSWKHAMKRSIGPGATVPLDELYEQYGVKHGIKEGKPFVDWLRQVKLKDTVIWDIRYREPQDTVWASAIKEDVVVSDTTKLVDNPVVEKSENKQSPFVKSNPKVDDIVSMSVRKAREFLPKFTDQKLLKYAINETSQLSNKDTLTRMLRKRIVELELSRR